MGALKVLVFFGVIVGCLSAKQFPENFLFGAAGASYQIEGGWDADGKGLSMWDVFAHTPGKIKNNDTGDVACDSYNKYKEDVAILKQLGLKVYRFSISWPRILPKGIPTEINQAGVDYYRNLIKELKDAGIEPLVTLYHWDLPQHLAELGGWLNPRIADYFGDYARICFELFGDQVKYWLPLNEPGTTCVHGYETGDLAPGLPLSGEGIYQCAYVHVLAHAKAWHIYNDEFRSKQGGKVGFNNVCFWFYPKSNNSEDIEAQTRAMEFGCGLYANPIYNGDWPQVVIDRVAYRSKKEGYSFSRLPTFTEEEKQYINGTSDYYGLNMYTSYLVEALADESFDSPSLEQDLAYNSTADPSWAHSASEWLNLDPPGIRNVLNYVNEKYNPGEIVVTENGWSDNGELDDQGRVTYLKGYLSNVLDAIVEDSINVIAYTTWSLMDNFEWNQGYTQKFGIVQVDFDSPNRTRTLKSSAEWYKRVAAAKEIVD
ncbi:hypothetical protein GWI33_022114 [Rhynchophorus ferrugineus]|uniref:Cytosolic beta-glucosidase n=1 Tax=Rhynchophorus ferrugineus TaxID=354439 RepID=A0A834IV87_RHYFE|nr:hypothetical protein GWI33_022114 [Rhynchophorus ferrugineus]